MSRSKKSLVWPVKIFSAFLEASFVPCASGVKTPTGAQLNPIAAGGRALYKTSGWQGYTRRPSKTRRWVRKAFISTSRAREISIRATEGPLTGQSGEGKIFIGHGCGRVKEKRVRWRGRLFLDPVHDGGDTTISLWTARRAFFGLCPCMLEKLLSSGPTQGRERAFPTVPKRNLWGPKKPNRNL